MHWLYIQDNILQCKTMQASRTKDSLKSRLCCLLFLNHARCRLEGSVVCQAQIIPEPQDKPLVWSHRGRDGTEVSLSALMSQENRLQWQALHSRPCECLQLEDYI